MVPLACGGQVATPQEKKRCHRTLAKKVISDSGFSLIDFCQKNCNSMSMAGPCPGKPCFFYFNKPDATKVSILQCRFVEFNGGFRGWPPFLAILNRLQAMAQSKCGKLLFSIIATTWQSDVVGYSQPKPHVTALNASAIKPAKLGKTFQMICHGFFTDNFEVQRPRTP